MLSWWGSLLQSTEDNMNSLFLTSPGWIPNCSTTVMGGGFESPDPINQCRKHGPHGVWLWLLFFNTFTANAPCCVCIYIKGAYIQYGRVLFHECPHNWDGSYMQSMELSGISPRDGTFPGIQDGGSIPLALGAGSMFSLFSILSAEPSQLIWKRVTRGLDAKIFLWS